MVSLTDEILQEQRREGIFAVLVVTTLGLLIAAWIAMRIGRSISRPLENLTAIVDTMEAGNLNLFATEEGPLELRKLASGINQFLHLPEIRFLPSPSWRPQRVCNRCFHRDSFADTEQPSRPQAVRRSRLWIYWSSD